MTNPIDPCDPESHPLATGATETSRRSAKQRAIPSHQQAILLLLLLPGPAEPLAAARLASGSEAICGEIWCARARWGPLTASLLHSAQLETCR